MDLLVRVLAIVKTVQETVDSLAVKLRKLAEGIGTLG
jgi:hypothetical protein